MMRDHVDHGRCSELLAPLLRGELDDEEAETVEAHLDSCADCSLERAGLRTLLETETAALTELERAKLRRVVLDQAVPLPDGGAAPAPASLAPRRDARLFRLLAAAAAVIVVGGFAYLGLGGGLEGDDSEGGVSTAVGGGGGDSTRVEDSQSRALQSSADAQGAESLPAQLAPPSPTFRPDLGKVDEKRLNKLGRAGLPLVVFSRAYTTADVPEHQTAFIEEVAAQAPLARGRDIRACAHPVTERFPNSLLAYAAAAEYKHRGDILILAFAWTDEKRGPLDRSMVWAWSIDDCDGIPVHYSTSVIQPRRNR